MIFQCCGVTSVDIIEDFENMLSNLNISIQFTKTTAFVPSFMEDWVFYSVWRWKLQKKKNSKDSERIVFCSICGNLNYYTSIFQSK